MPLQSKAFIEGILVVAVMVPIAVASRSLPVALASQGQEEVVRRARVPLRPLAEQLLPGDKIVEFFIDVDDERALPSRALRPLESLAMAVADSEQVLLVELKDAEAKLFDQDSWIATRLNCKVLDVLKAPRSSKVRPGSSVSFLVGGGELEINGVVVRANRKSPYEIGRTYVAFLRDEPIPAQGLTSEVASAYPVLVDRNRLKPFPGLSEELDGLTLSEVRRAAAKHR